MPTVDLRDPSDSNRLKPLAHFEVLAAMLSPNNKPKRENIMATVRREIGVGHARSGILSDNQSVIAQMFGNSRGSEAGFMMAELIRLHNQEIQPTLSKAIRLIQAELPKTLAGGRKADWQDRKSVV